MARKGSCCGNNCCTKLLKTLYILVQIIFLLIGIAITGFGLTALVKKQGFVLISKYFAVGLAALGATVIIASILGIVAATTGNKCTSALYILFLIALIAVQVLFIVFFQKLETRAKTGLSTLWDQFSDDTKKQLQIQGKCCGFESTKDRPLTPCPDGTSDGCFTHIQSLVSRVKTNMILVNALILSFELILIILTFVFCCHKKPSKKADKIQRAERAEVQRDRFEMFQD